MRRLDSARETWQVAMKIFNTLSGQKEDFVPLGDPVKMYVCGVTPYDESHVGHAMSYILFDTIRRYLAFRGYRVLYVQNFTDVDDKLIARAARLGVSVKELAERHISAFFDDMAALNVWPADVYVRATETIPKILEVVEGLVAKGYAYASGDDVYYRVTRDPEYGKLAHRSIDDMQAGARIEVDEAKEHPMDFALWKAAKPGEPNWASPFGLGRPGWHIECSAMILQHLGSQIDIHGGGQDLIFPHHENEIAQSESFTGLVPFVRYWMHNGLLQLGSEKMSKSLGNLVTIKDALAHHSADALRAFILGSYYRGPLTYTEEGLAAAERGVDRLRATVAGESASEATPTGPLAEAAGVARERFIQAMDDDFNTSAALASLYDLVREINRARESGAPPAVVQPAQATLRELAGVLGMTLATPPASDESVAARPFIELLVATRRDLRAAKQFALADRIRDELAKLSVVLVDRPDRTDWKLEH
jgi:cysteinyl-tRNA synthetase